MTPQEANQVLAPFLKSFQAALLKNLIEPGNEIHVETIDLATARDRSNPVEIPFNCVGFLVRTATDSNANVNVLLDSKDISAMPANFKLKDSLNAATPHRIFLYWTAQTAKTMTIEFYRSSQALPGSFSTSISQVYSSITTPAKAAVTAAAAICLASDSDRKSVVIENQDAANNAYLGGSTVTAPAGAFPGVTLAAGEKIVLQQSSDIYAICDAGLTATLAFLVEK